MATLLTDLPTRLRTLATSLITLLTLAELALFAIVDAIGDDWPAGTSWLIRAAAALAGIVTLVRTHMPAAKTGDPNGLLPTADYPSRLAQLEDLLDTTRAEAAAEHAEAAETAWRASYTDGAQVAAVEYVAPTEEP